MGRKYSPDRPAFGCGWGVGGGGGGGEAWSVCFYTVGHSCWSTANVMKFGWNIVQDNLDKWRIQINIFSCFSIITYVVVLIRKHSIECLQDLFWCRNRNYSIYLEIWWRERLSDILNEWERAFFHCLLIAVFIIIISLNVGFEGWLHIVDLLMFCTMGKIFGRWHIEIFFPEKRIWHFMQINLHEMSNPVFWEK